jgi:hypothetical protein
MAHRPLKYDPAGHMDQVVTAQGIEGGFWPDSELAQFAGHENLAW